MKQRALKVGPSPESLMCCYARKVVSLASSNLRSQKDETIKLIYPRISVLGILGMPAALLFLLLGTALGYQRFS